MAGASSLSLVTLKGRSLAPNGHSGLGGGWLDTEEYPLVGGEGKLGRVVPETAELSRSRSTTQVVDVSGHLGLHEKAACQHSTSQTDRQTTGAGPEPCRRSLPSHGNNSTSSSSRAQLKEEAGAWAGGWRPVSPPTVFVLWLQ